MRMSWIGIVGFACAAVASSACSHSSEVVPPAASVAVTAAASPEEARALTLVDELSHGAWTHDKTRFGAEMESAMPPEKVRAAWTSLQDAAGAFQRVEGTRRVDERGYRIVHVTCRFARTRKILRVVFDQDAKVAGFFYRPVPEDLEAKTRSLVTAAARGDFDLAMRDFGDKMKRAASPSMMAAAWREVEAKIGPWRAIERVDLKSDGGYWISLATCRFERERVTVKVVYDARDDVAGFFFKPVEVPWSPPGYVKTATFEGRPVTVGAHPALPGTLTMPKGAVSVPGVVLVHGSGPNDEDESVGGVKPFKDLAWGLASRGIAVLRYVKRTRHAPAGVVTQKEEVLDAAHDAIELLQHTPGIDPARIFVIGHSQGGEQAPRIAEAHPNLAGIVILAGPARPLQDLMIDQYTYFASLHPEDAERTANIERARAFKRTIEDPALKADQDVDFPTGGRAKGAYFLDMRAYDPVATAQKLGCRLLVLQGERDYQVTMKDFERWKSALGSKKGVTLKTYPANNHLFVAGSGAPNPDEYELPGHVDDAVVRDIADWIQSS